MRSLEKRFNKISKRYPSWSSYLCFASAIKGQDFDKKIIYKWFDTLVEKDDYVKDEKFEVLASLLNLTKPLEEGMN